MSWIPMILSLSLNLKQVSREPLIVREAGRILQNYDYYDINSVVFKITDKCNLGCRYCYRLNSNTRINRNAIDYSIIQRTLESILAFKTDLYARYEIHKVPHINFIWHGGEPMLAGIQMFESILRIQDLHKDSGLKINNIIQTNGTLIDHNFIDLFKRHDFTVGISIDGPHEIQDIHRCMAGGTSSFDATLRGINLLNDNGINWSAIAVINKEYVGHEQEIYNFFREVHPKEIDFTPSFLHNSEFTLNNQDYANFMNRMFDLWIQDLDSCFSIRYLKDLMYKMGYLRIKDKKSIICDLSGKCHRNISIFTNGDVYSCECLNTLKDNRIGNIMESEISDMIHGKRFKELSQQTNEIHPDCISCRDFPICKAGCFNRRVPWNGIVEKDYYCEARKSMMMHMRMVCDRILSMEKK